MLQRRIRNADALEQRTIPRIAPQPPGQWITVEIREPVVMLVDGLSQPLQRGVTIADREIQSEQLILRHVRRSRPRQQLRDNSARRIRVTGESIGNAEMRQPGKGGEDPT